MTISQGKLFVVSAPSGAGKTSLVKALVDKHQDIQVSVSHTTRTKRRDEQDGINYHFVSRSDFEELDRQDGFLESAEVFGNLYGTGKQAVDQSLALGNHLVLEIDWQGAQQIRRRLPDAELIFILPPSMSSLRERLNQRGQDDNDTINCRMAEAISEMSHYNEFDYIIVNDNFDSALEQIRSITIGDAADLAVQAQNVHLVSLLENLLPGQSL